MYYWVPCKYYIPDMLKFSLISLLFVFLFSSEVLANHKSGRSDKYAQHNYQEALDVNIDGVKNIKTSKDTALVYTSKIDALASEQRNLMSISITGFLLVLLMLSVFVIAQLIKRNQLILRDFEKRKIEKRKNKVFTELDDQRNNLLLTIAHELQQPLSIIIGVSDLLDKEYTSVNKKLTKYTNIISNNAHRTSHLVTRMLEHAKVELNKFEITMESFNIVTFISSAINDLEFLISTKGIIVDYEQQLEDSVIYSDKERIGIIFNNIFTNALRNTPGGGLIKIIVRDYDQDNIAIIIADSGKGIPEKKYNDIFKRFYQDEGSDNKEGFGLGLSICKDFVTDLEGKIQLSSDPDKETTFTVVLPKNTEHISEVEINSNLETTPHLHSHDEVILPQTYPDDLDEQAVILIVEDDPDFLYFLECCLSSRFKLLKAKNGSEAKDLLELHIPDLVITDWIMPNGNGEELILHIKSDVLYGRVRIIMLTGKPLVTDKLKIAQLGVDGYLNKPVKAEQLLKEIYAVLDRTKHNVSQFHYFPELKNLTENDRKFLIEFREFITSNLGKFDLNLALIAEAMSVSLPSLNRKVKKLTGIATKSYIQQFRYWEARKLMEEKKVTSVKEACYTVGFKDVKNFSRNFKSLFGKYPREYLG